ncbi:MAG: class I SAM-dependent methyltransferase [Halobacteriovoraceae bacterium]|nr:class I SAM-dependent methyltransferase [Halobacteriovoraceae bacterium]
MKTSSKSNSNLLIPDHTAVRTSLWRALHVQIDPKPHVFVDEVGAKLVDEKNWRDRADMDPQFSKSMRASIVGRARFIEDLVEENISSGISQYVILGAGLDAFSQRRPELARKIQIFEIDQPATQKWKQNRLLELGFNLPKSLHFVPVDFEAGQSWWDKLLASGFDKNKPTIVVSTGVSMYLSNETNKETLQKLATLAPGSTFAMTFLLSPELLNPEEKTIMEFVMKKAKESGTPFLSLFSPAEIVELATNSGFKRAEFISALVIYERYFAKRTDGLRAGEAEAFLLATIE